MNVTLVLVQQDQKQREIPLRKPSVVIGRDVSSQIRIPSDAISRRHCEIVLSDDAITLKDLGSSNGTFVNRRRITQTELAPGDVIGMGTTVLVVRIDGEPKSIDSATALSMIPTAAPPAVPARSAAAAGPSQGKPSSILDDDDLEAGGSRDELEDSSLSDFDFLDDEDDEKGQPKL